MDRRRPAHLHVAIPALTLTALPSPLLSAALFSPMSEDASFLPVTPPCGPNANPFLAGFVRGGLTRRNSSLSSCSSSVNSEEEEHDLPWTAAEEDRIRDVRARILHLVSELTITASDVRDVHGAPDDALAL